MATTAAGQFPLDRWIRLRGARQNNLRNVDIDIPKGRITVFTGVSGSGKSSVVFDCIASESKRLIDETYPAFLQGLMPTLIRPDMDSLEGVTPAIAVDQEPLGANARSTVGTVTDAYAMLRSLYSAMGQPYVGPPAAFSFNIPTVTVSGVSQRVVGDQVHKELVQGRTYVGGMCDKCEGRGTIADVDMDVILNQKLSLNQGAILVPGYTADGWLVRTFTESGFVDPNKPLERYTAKERQDFLYKEPTKIKAKGINVTYEGLINKLNKSLFSKDRDSLQPHMRDFADRAATVMTCPQCQGTRLTAAVLECRIQGVHIAQVSHMPIVDIAAWVQGLQALGGQSAPASDTPAAPAPAKAAQTSAASDTPAAPASAPASAPAATTDIALQARAALPLLGALAQTLESLIGLGLGYLTLDRPAGSLSGGEAQRVRMVRHLGSALTDMTYVFDEPSIGMHPHDISRMNTVLCRLRDKGNTVLVVEHKPEVIGIADYVIDMGPGAGSQGGQVCFTGTVQALRTSGTVTGQHLGDRAALKAQVRDATGLIAVTDVTCNNLDQVSVDFPLGLLTVVTGVAGSGKSSLIHGGLLPAARTAGIDLAVIDQSVIRGNRRSNPATYTGLLDPVRAAFAKAHGVKPGLFSANSDGACPVCQGNGVVEYSFGYMETISTPCQACDGRRFGAHVLGYTLGGASIADVFDMSVDAAGKFFAPDGPAPLPAAHVIVERLHDVGLGYIALGQQLTTLSGGERQRLKLAVALASEASVLVLDEPTTGLHLADVTHLLALLDSLVDSGRTVVVVEHHQAVMAHGDWIIDLGPGAGADGGRLVFAGTPAQLVTDQSSLTGQYLAQYVAAGRRGIGLPA